MKNLQINGVIGCDVMSKDIISQLKSFGNEDVTVELHSPGGSVFEGLAIYNALKSYPGKVKMKIMGLAASMATVIAYAKGKPTTAKSSVFMIHNVQGFAAGDYREMAEMSKLCENLTKMLANIYKDATGKKITDIRDMMDKTTTMFGRQIVTEGFAESLSEDGDDDTEEDALAMAQLEVEDCIAKMKLYKEKSDPALVAMMINSFTAQITDPKPIPAKIPADAGNNTTEVTTMTLTEFLAQNPAAQTEFNAAIEASKNAGVEETKKAMTDTITAASAFVGVDSKYPAPIQAIAKDVMNGKSTMDNLKMAVALYDSLKQQNASTLAQGETAQLGDTPGETGHQPGIEKFGHCENNSDFDAEVKRSRKEFGLPEVK